MNNPLPSLFGADHLVGLEGPPDSPEEQHTTGILPASAISALIRDREIIPLGGEIMRAQIQPASLDLRLGKIAHRVRASFLPGPGASVADKLRELSLHQIDLSDGAVLERNCVYVVELAERLSLSSRISATANPKSSTGRIDVFTRLITDRATTFDQVPAGYKGPIYAEICPRTFGVLVREGSRLNQMRFRRGAPMYKDAEHRRWQAEFGLVSGNPEISDGVALRVDLTPDPLSNLIGYRAKHHSALIDVDRIGEYDVLDYWEPLRTRSAKSLILDPDEFYILVSKETVHVPAHLAAEMVPYNPLFGEFRVHYAGFFDPGFGSKAAGGEGSRAVLEVRSHELPFMLEDGQIIGQLRYERLTQAPTQVYGETEGSNYQRQGLKLSKHFKPL